MRLSRALLLLVAFAGFAGCTMYYGPEPQRPAQHPGYAPDGQYAGAPGAYYEPQPGDDFDEPRAPDYADARDDRGVDDNYGPYRDDPRCNCRCDDSNDRHVVRRYEPDNPSAWLE